MADSKRWTVTYTKHIKQNRKVYKDGFLHLQVSSSKAGTGIAELIALEISKKTKAPVEETRKKIWLVDSKVFNMDGGRFIKAMFSSDKTKSITQVVMKLPNVAAEFLGCLTLMRIQCNNRCSFSRKRE